MEVTINPTTPSQELSPRRRPKCRSRTRAGAIRLKKPGVLAQYRLVEVLGDSAKNEVYMAMVLPLLYVAAIDDQPNPTPTRKSEVEALFQRWTKTASRRSARPSWRTSAPADPEADKAQLKK
jgi:hypothetical protein